MSFLFFPYRALCGSNFSGGVFMTWPKDSPETLEAFYGPLVLGASGRPTAKWERENLASFPAPYPLALSWNPAKKVSRVTCHEKVAASLTCILQAILDCYKTQEEIEKARMHLYGGCYCFRPSRGSNRLSVHAYGAAVDLDPEANPMGKPYGPAAGMMPM
jgi:hypothetical protein